MAASTFILRLIVTLLAAQCSSGWLRPAVRCRPVAKPLRAPAPMLIMDPVKGLETAASALQNTGDTVVFDNVNMVSALVLGLKRLLAGKSSGNLRAAFRSLASGVGDRGGAKGALARDS